MPYPPDYGGAIDVFYKIKALSALGIRIKLHCFEYGNRRQESAAVALGEYCEQVHYYPRLTGGRGLWGLYPYIVASRRSDLLLKNLLEDEAPIFFEGLHSCFYLPHPQLKKRLKLVRVHNIEADYYQQLCINEPMGWRKLYFAVEQWLLRRYAHVLRAANYLLPIALPDAAYLEKYFEKVVYLPAFHGNTLEDVAALSSETGNFALYHGNLQVSENRLAALFLAEKVFAQLDYPLVIAGKMASNDAILLNENKKPITNSNLHITANPDYETLQKLFHSAQIHVLPAFQTTGIKLKLINSLYNGRHCLANEAMVNGTGLEALCHIANTPEEFRQKIKDLSALPFDVGLATQRQLFLKQNFDDISNAQKIIDLL